MAQRRSDIVDAESPGVYHCISRCVRREALLQSDDRRNWIVTRLEWLARHLAVDVIAFAVMENHVHLLLRIRPDIVSGWSDREVAHRRIAMLPNLRRRSRNGIARGDEPTESEVNALLSSPLLLRRARRDLSSLGFFHRLLKEPCARAWNREDGVTGHFWEGRFLSPRVLDDVALLRVSRYVELNEVRACRADSIRASVWTSARRQWERLRDRLRCILERSPASIEAALDAEEWSPVFPCCGATAVSTPRQPPGQSRQAMALVDYLATLEFAGRCRHPHKPGWIRAPRSSILDALSEALRDLDAQVAPARHEVLLRVESRFRSAFAGFIESAPSATPPGRATRPTGSCYGDAASVLREAARRGVKRVFPIPLPS